MENSQRTFEKFLKDHSIIVAKHMDGSAYNYDEYPLIVLPQLEMFIIENLPDINSYVEFKVDGVKHEIVYDDWSDYSRIFVEANKHLTGFAFTELAVSYVENGAGYGSDI